MAHRKKTAATPKLELYVFDFCPYCQRALITLHHGKIPHRLIVLEPDNLPPDFSEISPLGNVPVLRVNDSETLFESTVINDYLASLSSTPMLGADTLQQAKHRAWGEYAGTCQAALMQLLKAENADATQQAAQNLIDALTPLEHMMDKSGPYFCGDHISTIDAVYAPLFMRMDEIARHTKYLQRSQLTPRLRQWQQALLDNEAVHHSVIGDFPQVFRGFIGRKAKGGYIDKLLS